MIFSRNDDESAATPTGRLSARPSFSFATRDHDLHLGRDHATAEELEAAGGGRAAVKDPEVAKQIFGRITSGTSWVGELEMVTKKGRVFPAYERADTIKNHEGKIIGLIGVITDITERKRAEEALRRSEKRHRTILQTAMDGFWLLDMQGRLLEVNEAYCRMSGYSAEAGCAVSCGRCWCRADTK